LARPRPAARGGGRRPRGRGRRRAHPARLALSARPPRRSGPAPLLDCAASRGGRMADHEFPVDRTAILAFAAAIGETNPIYWDEAYAARTPLGGVIAPPTFAIASAHWNPDYALR